MGDGIHDSFANDCRGEFILTGSLGRLLTGTYAVIEFGQDKIDTLLDLREEISLEDPIVGSRALDGGSVKVHAPHFYGREKPLRRLPKEKKGRIGGALITKEIKMSENLLHGGYLRDGKLPVVAGAPQELANRFRVEVV